MDKHTKDDGERKDSLVSRTLFIARAYSDNDLDNTERVLEEELRRESTVPPRNHKLARIRHLGELVVHSKHVLLLIVVLNLIDCALVLGELVLDIHYIKELREHSELSSQNFINEMQYQYPEHLYGDYDFEHIDVLYEHLYSANCTWEDHSAGKHNGHHNYSVHMDIAAYKKTTHAVSDNTRKIGSHNRSQRSLETATPGEHGPEYNVVRNRTLHGLDSEHSDTESHHGSNTNHHAHSIWMDIAHGMHKASICILGMLFVESIIKVILMGRRFFIKKLEVFDAVVVILSFTIDLVFLKGLSGYKVQDALLILSFLLPWRVIRVVNSLIVAVLDHEHFRLKMLYQEKKAIAAELKILKEMAKKWDFHLHKIEKFCESEGIPKWKIRQHTALGRKQSTITSMASLALNGVLTGMLTSSSDYELLAKSLCAQDSTSTNLTDIDEDGTTEDDDLTRQSSVTESEIHVKCNVKDETAPESNNNGSEKAIVSRYKTCPKGSKRVSFDSVEDKPLLSRQLSFEFDDMKKDDVRSLNRTSCSSPEFNKLIKNDHANV